MDAAPAMRLADGDLWELEMEGSLGQAAEFKLAICRDDAYERYVQFEEGPNRTLAGADGVVPLVFGQTLGTVTIPVGRNSRADSRAFKRASPSYSEVRKRYIRCSAGRARASPLSISWGAFVASMQAYAPI